MRLSLAGVPTRVQRGPNFRLNAEAIETVAQARDITPGTRDWLHTMLTYADDKTGEAWPTQARVRRGIVSRRSPRAFCGERSCARWQRWAVEAGYVTKVRVLPGQKTPKGKRANHGTTLTTIVWSRLGLCPTPRRRPPVPPEGTAIAAAAPRRERDRIANVALLARTPAPEVSPQLALILKRGETHVRANAERSGKPPVPPGSSPHRRERGPP